MVLGTAAGRSADSRNALCSPMGLPLHLPAHGRGRGLSPALRRLLRQRPGSWDLPELPEQGGPLIDTGAVAEAQRRCASQLGAEALWFGVNGASGLLLPRRQLAAYCGGVCTTAWGG